MYSGKKYFQTPPPQVEAVSQDWASRAALPQHVVQMVNRFPSNLHPMSQFSAAITAMNSESKFARAYADGINKTKYWEVGGVRGGVWGTSLYIYTCTCRPWTVCCCCSTGYVDPLACVLSTIQTV